MKNMESNHENLISNEFAMVRYEKVLVGNGERLLLEIPGSNQSILLDSVILESIVEVGIERLSEIVSEARD